MMSVGLMIEDDDQVVWRGPVAQNTLTDLFTDVSWGSLDYFVVDLPPGTGDVQLTVLQHLPVTGTVVVTTPQSVAVDDTRRGIEMFGEYQTNVLGVLENMSGFVCPGCGDTHEIFGEDGGQGLADAVEVPYLESLPLNPAIRVGADTGKPIVRQDTGKTAEAFQDLQQCLQVIAHLFRQTPSYGRLKPAIAMPAEQRCKRYYSGDGCEQSWRAATPPPPDY